MNPEGSVFFKGGKEFSPVHLFAAHSFCQTCTRYKARHTRTHTYTHALHTISNDEEKKKKKNRMMLLAALAKKKIKEKEKETLHTHIIIRSTRASPFVRLSVPGQGGPPVTATTPLFLLEMSGCPRPLGRGGVCARQAGSKEGGRESSMSVQVYHHDGRRGCSPLAHNSPRARAGEGGSSSTQWGPIYSGGHRNNK